MEFIRNLEEARLTRNLSNVKSLTYTDCCERAYLSVLILELLRRYPELQSEAATYASKTLAKSDYSQFRAFATDLYNFVYFIVGDDTALEKLKDPKSAKKARSTVTLPVLGLNRYLRGVASGSRDTNDARFLLGLESSLKISNPTYSQVRRNVANYHRLTLDQRKATVTTLLYAARAKLRSSDIIDHLSSLASQRDLESPQVRDIEPKISVPDKTAKTLRTSDVALYRLLVGSGNLMRTKRFLELAQQGSSIPTQMVQGYKPIIDMVDDIVSGGFMYIQLLKQVHNRAKKASK